MPFKCEHGVTNWWQWPDSIYSFPEFFCHDPLPTQSHALLYVVLTYVIYRLDELAWVLSSHCGIELVQAVVM